MIPDAHIEAEIAELEGRLALRRQLVRLRAEDRALGKLEDEGRARRIVDAVSHQAGVSVAALLGRNREQRVADARFLAFHLIRAHTGLSVTVIGRMFQRNHSDVSYGVKRAGALLASDRRFAALATAIEAQIKATTPKL